MHDYDLERPATLCECRALDRAALAAGPVARGPEGIPFFLRYEDVLHLLVHPDASPGGTLPMERQGIHDGILHEWFSNFFALLDPPRHTRLRAVVGRSFAVRPIEGLRAVARRAAEDALDILRDGREFDPIADVAWRMPVRVICGLLGIPDVGVDHVTKWIDDLGPAISTLSMSAAQRATAELRFGELYAFLAALVEQRRARPQADVISLLASAEQAGELSHAELLAMLSGLFFAGVDTTRSLVAIALYLFAEHPGELAKLQQDPDLAPSAFEEIFRFAAPVPWMARFAAQRIERAGVTLEPGDLIAVSLAAANADQEGVVDPDRFDIARPPTQHLGFGRGRHFCLGAALARLEGQEMLRALAARRLRLAVVGDTPRWIRAGLLMRPSEPLRLRVRA